MACEVSTFTSTVETAFFNYFGGVKKLMIKRPKWNEMLAPAFKKGSRHLLKERQNKYQYHRGAGYLYPARTWEHLALKLSVLKNRQHGKVESIQ